MNSNFDPQLHYDAVQRALALGRSTDPAALAELASLLKMPSAEVRRLAASAIGKLAAFGAHANAAVLALAPVALRDPHPQVQQYALKGLKCYGPAARQHLQDLDDLAGNLGTNGNGRVGLDIADIPQLDCDILRLCLRGRDRHCRA